MTYIKKLVIGAAALMAICVQLAPVTASAALRPDQKGRLDAYVHMMHAASKIPGMAVVVVQGEETVYEQYAGFSDIGKQSPVTADTVFELGSNSKAFTGLAILQLQQQGDLQLEDPVSRYLPWFSMSDHGVRYDPTLAQLLHHTSAIPPATIGRIPASNADDALEQTVRLLAGQEVSHHPSLQPGQYFLYATINYDVLGLVIQQVTGKPYEDYMQEHIVRPLGLNHTYMRHEEALQHGLSTGYKLELLRPHVYEAPRYRGNTPAGYVNSTAADMAKWMKIQLGAVKPQGIEPAVIELSHEGDPSVVSDVDGSGYAAGWSVDPWGGGEISHGGSNPNFSSFIAMGKDGVGVAVLANMNSDLTEAAARGVMAIMHGSPPGEPRQDSFSQLDTAASAVLIASGLLLLVFVTLSVRCLAAIRKGKRRRMGLSVRNTTSLLAVFFVFALYLVGLYDLPMALFGKLPWNVLYVWAPFTLAPASAAAGAAGAVIAFYFGMTRIFVKATPPAGRAVHEMKSM